MLDRKAEGQAVQSHVKGAETPPLLAETIPQLLAKTVAANAEREAVIFPVRASA